MTDTPFDSWAGKNPLKEYRAQRGVSIDYLAQELGVPKNDMQDWEEGIKIPNNQNFALLADELGLPKIKLDWMAWAEDKPN